jgi:hypothetical protein
MKSRVLDVVPLLLLNIKQDDADTVDSILLLLIELNNDNTISKTSKVEFLFNIDNLKKVSIYVNLVVYFVLQQSSFHSSFYDEHLHKERKEHLF